MAYTFSVIDSENLTGSPPVTTYPFTFHCWFRVSSTAAAQTLVSIGPAASSNEEHTMYLDSGQVVYRCKAGGSNYEAGSSTTHTADTWNSGQIVGASATDRRAYLNGGGRGDEVTNVTPSAADRLGIGRRGNNFTSQMMDGQIADVAIWNEALDDAEIAELGLGVSPLRIRPAALVFYAPLVRDINDLVSATVLTEGGTPEPTGEHPPVIKLRAGRFGMQETGVSASRSQSPSSSASPSVSRSQSPSSSVSPSVSPSGSASPYPASTYITGITWDWPNVQTAAPGSDLWPATWSDDDNIYTSWGDGGGFGGTDVDGRVSLGFGRIEGTPASWTGYNVWGGKTPENPATFEGKCLIMISIAGVLYAWIANEDPIDSETPGELVYSSDHGATWTHTDIEWANPAISFNPCRVVNWGKDNAGAPDNYVYLYGFDRGGDYTDMYLARCLKTELLVTEAVNWEYFTGTSGSPAWGLWADATPVFSDDNIVYDGDAFYHAPSGRVLLTVQRGYMSQFGIFDAPNPWGPWTTVCYYDDFGSFGTEEGLAYCVPLKWVNESSMWVFYSGGGAHDGFNMVEATLTGEIGSESPSVSPSASVSRSVSPSVSPSASVSASVSPSVTAGSSSVSPSVSRSVSHSPSRSRSPSASYSPSSSRSPSASPSPSLAPQPIGPTLFQEYGLTLVTAKPLWKTSGAHFQSEYSREIATWEHEIDAKGGFKSARFTINANRMDIENWLENGLGRDIKCYSPKGQVLWEGFVNQVTASLGTLSVTRGPLMNVANRVSVVYTPYVDVCVDPPTTGAATVTTLADDAASQAKYGIIEEVVSGGTLIDDATVHACDALADSNQAEEIRDAYLEEYKNPETSQTLSIGQSAAPQMTLECLGYEAFLDQYVYNATTAGYTTVPLKLQAVLTADPNNIFSSDYTGIADDAAHSLIASAFDDSDRLARAVIDELVNQGDGSKNRTLFMILQDRKAHYASIPTEIEYYHSLSDPRQRIYNAKSSEIPPWEIQAGKWLRITDFMIGRSPDVTSLREDVRVMFIENVRYTSPWNVVLTGVRITKVKQLIAQYGGSS